MISRYFFACLLLGACRIEKDRNAVPAKTAWVVDDDARTAGGVQMFSLTRDGAFSMQPGQSGSRPRITLTCVAENAIIARVLLPRPFVPTTASDSEPVMVRWRTDEGSPTHTESWIVVRSRGDSLVAVQSPPGLARQIRTARALTIAFAHAQRPEEILFELDGLGNYLAEAAGTCHLDPRTLQPLGRHASAEPL